MAGLGGVDNRRQVVRGTREVEAANVEPAARTEEPSPVAPAGEAEPASPQTVRDARARALGAEVEARARVQAAPTEETGPRATRGLERGANRPADLEARVDALEAEGRRGAFAESPAAAADWARRMREVAPHLDAETRQHLQRPIDEFAANAARTQSPPALAIAGELAPVLGPRGTEAFARALLESPDAATRAQSVAVLDRVSRENLDPRVRQAAAHGILNDAPTVAQALRGEHPTLTRDRVAELAAADPARTNQLLDRARDLDPTIEQDLLGRGLARTQLPEVDGVLGGVIDGVEGLAAPFVSPLETARGLGRLAGSLATDPVGTARAIAGSVVEAVENDPARALTGALVGSIGGGPGQARRLAAAGRIASHVDDAARAADDVARVAGRAGAAALGDLRPREVQQIQSVVEEAQRRMDRVLQSVGEAPGALPVDLVVVGSAARGARRNPDSNLPFGKGPGTRSDVDYAVPDRAVREHVFTDQGLSRPEQRFWNQLPGFDTRTVGGQLHEGMPPIDQPRIWFRAGREPVFLAPGQPNPTVP